MTGIDLEHKYRDVVAWMMPAIVDAKSALHTSCVAMRAAGTQRLARAQLEGVARTDIDGTDLFALPQRLRGSATNLAFGQSPSSCTQLPWAKGD